MEATPLSFLHAIGELKHLARTGWLRNIPNPESVAAHSFRVAIMAMVVPEYLGLDTSRCVQMALVHDLAESVIGDIPTFAQVPPEQKYAMEDNGFQYLANLLRPYSPKGAEYMRELWLEYEKGETREAKWVKEMDKLECLAQAFEYEQRTFGEKNVEEFQGLNAKIHSEEASKWAKSLSQQRQIHRARRERQLPIIFIMGDSAVSEKVAEDVSLRLELPHISVNKIVSGRAKDPKFLHHGVIQTCLDRGFDLPAGLVVDLIECEIKRMGDRPWTIISGFPKDKEQLECFERKVQHSNYAVWVESTLHTDHSTQMLSSLEVAMQKWRPSAIEFKETLKSSMRHFAELTMPVPEKDLCTLTAIVVEALTKDDKAS